MEKPPIPDKPDIQPRVKCTGVQAVVMEDFVDSEEAKPIYKKGGQFIAFLNSNALKIEPEE